MKKRISQKEARELVQIEMVKIYGMDDIVCPEWADNEVRGVRFNIHSAAEAAQRIQSRSVKSVGSSQI